MAFSASILLVGPSEQLGDDAGAIFFDFDFRREGTVDGIDGDLFDRIGFAGSAAAGQDSGQVEAGYLEAVEEQAGSARVDIVGGYAAKNFADGVLDGAAVFGQGQFEGGSTAAALTWVFEIGRAHV